MLCPVCVEQGKTSCVYPGDSFTTCAGINHYFDERGNEHWHNPNSANTTYTCSNGHRFMFTAASRCTTEGCDFGLPAQTTVYEHTR